MANRMKRRNEELVTAFAMALSEQRERAQLTQEELAERADVSARFISFLETSRRQPSLSALHALSKGLGIQMLDLIAEAERIYEESNLADPKDTDQT